MIYQHIVIFSFEKQIQQSTENFSARYVYQIHVAYIAHMPPKIGQTQKGLQLKDVEIGNKKLRLSCKIAFGLCGP